MNQVVMSPSFALTFFICLNLIYTSIAQNPTASLTPTIYIASEGNSVVQFICTVSQPTPIIGFTVNGNILDNPTQEIRSIMTNKVNGSAARLTIQPLLLNNMTSLGCYSIINGIAVMRPTDAVLLVQGLLSAPSAMSIIDSTHASFRLLSWTAPFTLDLTDQEPDIIGYRVCFNIPPPSGAAAEMMMHCVHTQEILYSYLNVRLTLQFSVTPLNVVGDGDSSFVTHQSCTAGMSNESPGHFTLCIHTLGAGKGDAGPIFFQPILTYNS